MIDRRTFFKQLAAAAAIGLGPGLRRARAYETPADQGHLIMILQRGGLDGLFAFAPIDDPRLASLRPTLAATVLAQGIRLAGTGFGAHPSCAKLAELYGAGELAFAPCAGTIDKSRSHFQAQDLFELGTGRLGGDTGFMARAAQALGGTGNAISFTQAVPLAFQGMVVPPEVAPLAGSGLHLPQGEVLEAIRRAHRGRKTGDELEQAISTENEIEATAGMEIAATRGAPGANQFPALAQHMGRMLAANPRLGLAFIDLGGFDTHIAEDANLSRSLDNFSAGIVALKDALGASAWRRTRLVVMTEFGRTVHENGTQGTDHGHGGLALVVGGSIAGARLLAGFPGLAERDLNDSRDLPVLVDWRDLIGQSLASLFGISSAQLDGVFPGRPGQKILV